MRSRPDGGVVMGWGWGLLVLGGLLLVIGLIMPTFSDPGRDAIGTYVPAVLPTINPWKWPLIWLGLGLTNVSVLMLLAAYIVRAISFLPDRDGAGASPRTIPSSQRETEEGEVAPPDAAATAFDPGGADRATLWLMAVCGLIAAIIIIVAMMPGKASGSIPSRAAGIQAEVNPLSRQSGGPARG